MLKAMRERITLREPNANMTIFTSARIDPVDEWTVAGTVYGFVLSGDRPVEVGDEPIQLGHPGGEVEYSEYRIRCELTEEGWKIADLSMHPLFINTTEE